MRIKRVELKWVICDQCGGARCDQSWERLKRAVGVEGWFHQGWPLEQGGGYDQWICPVCAPDFAVEAGKGAEV